MSLLNSKENLTEESKKSKEEHIADLIKNIRKTESEIEPFKDYIKDLKKNYVENGYLTKEELKKVIKSYNMLKNGDFDLDEFLETLNKVQKCM